MNYSKIIFLCVNFCFTLNLYCSEAQEVQETLAMPTLPASTFYNAMPRKIGRPFALFEVIIHNDTNLVLQIHDTITHLDGRKTTASYQLKPTQQTPVNLLHYNDTSAVARFVSLQGATLTGSKKYTNTIIIGNTPPATLQPGGNAPGGVYSISQAPNNQFVIVATTQKDALDAGALVFSRSLQLWDVTLKNTTKHILFVRDEIDGPQKLHYKNTVIKPDDSAILSWSQYFSAQKTRKLIIWTRSKATASKPSNIIIIGNTPDATYLPEGGTPGGIYTIGSLKDGTIAVRPES